MIDGKNKDKKGFFLDRIGYETGMERDGYQGGVLVVIRNVPGGGMKGLNFPVYHHFNVPKNIETSKERNQNILLQFVPFSIANVKKRSKVFILSCKT